MERFDGAAIWPTLTPEQQAAIGAAALELVVAERGRGTFEFTEEPEPSDRALAASFGPCAAALEDAVDAAVPEERQRGVPSLLGPVCRECGCSQNDACDDGGLGCSWVQADLCSACATDSQRAAARRIAESDSWNPPPPGRQPGRSDRG